MEHAAPAIVRYFGNTAYGDGAGFHGKRDATRGCGFAVGTFAVNGNSLQTLALARGPLAGFNQQVPAAELVAWITYVKHVCPLPGCTH